MYLYYNTLFEKKQAFFVRKFKKLKLFYRIHYNSVIIIQKFVAFFVNISARLVIDFF